jgi:Spy/CpxP family protein refolding chaperone
MIMALPAMARGPDGPCPFGKERGDGPRGPGFGKGERGDMGMGLCLRAPELGLTQDQVAQIDALKEHGREATREMRDTLRGMHQDLRAAFTDSSVDASVLKAKAAAMHDIKDQLRAMKVDLMLQARAVLTADQLKILADLGPCDGMRKGRGMGKGHGKGRGFGDGQNRR